MDFKREEIPFPRYGSLTPEESECIAHISANNVENMELVHVSEGKLMKDFGCVFAAKFENAAGQIRVRGVIPYTQRSEYVLIVNELKVLREPQVRSLQISAQGNDVFRITMEIASDNEVRNYAEWFLRFCRFAFVRKENDKNILSSGVITNILGASNPQPDVAKLIFDVAVSSNKEVAQYGAANRVVCIDTTVFYRLRFQGATTGVPIRISTHYFCPTEISWCARPEGVLFSDTLNLGIISLRNLRSTITILGRKESGKNIDAVITKKSITQTPNGGSRMRVVVAKDNDSAIRQIFSKITSFDIKFRGDDGAETFKVVAVSRLERSTTVDYYYVLGAVLDSGNEFSIEGYTYSDASPRMLKTSPSGLLYGIGLGSLQEANFGVNHYNNKTRCQIVRSVSAAKMDFTDAEGKLIYLDFSPHIDIDDVILSMDFLGGGRLVFFFTKKILIYAEIVKDGVHTIGSITDVISDGLVHPKMHFRSKNEVYFFSERGLRKIIQNPLGTTVDVIDVEISNSKFLDKVPRVYGISTLADYEAFISVSVVSVLELGIVIIKVRDEFFYISLRADQVFLSKMRVPELLEERGVLFNDAHSLFLARNGTFYKYGAEPGELVRNPKAYPAVGKIVYVVQFRDVWRNAYIEPNFIFLSGTERVKNFLLKVEDLDRDTYQQVSLPEVRTDTRLPCQFVGRKFRFTIQYSGNSEISYKSMTFFGNYQNTERRS